MNNKSMIANEVSNLFLGEIKNPFVDQPLFQQKILFILRTISPSLKIATTFKLAPLSKKARFFMAHSERMEYKPISDAIKSVGEIFYEFTANENVNYENLNREFYRAIQYYLLGKLHFHARLFTKTSEM